MRHPGPRLLAPALWRPRRIWNGVYRRSAGGAPQFVEVAAPTDEALQAELHQITTRLMKPLTRRGVLVEEEEGSTCIADNDGDSDEARTLRRLQAAAWPRVQLPE